MKMSLVPRCLKRFHGKKSDFTIDHILNVAGEKHKKESYISEPLTMDVEQEKFEWLNCTRYRPPKLQRQRRKEGTPRRKLGRNPRIPFSSSQIAFLEAKFLRTPYLSSTDVTQLASHLKLTETRVKIWFQNRRAREKRENENRNKINESKTIQSHKFSPVSHPRNEHLNTRKNFVFNCSFPLTYLTCVDGTENYSPSPLDLSDKQIITMSE